MRDLRMAEPFFPPEDRQQIRSALEEILDSSLSMGKHVAAFEEEFASYIGIKHAVAMNSCTSALEVALQAKEVRGKKVIVPAETFIATGAAVVLAGATPVFAEISPKTLCIDVAQLESMWCEDVVGVIAVHMAGRLSPDLPELREFCNRKGMFLIEDAAHGPGAVLNSMAMGTFGDVACFSFYPTKIITSGEGGMLVTNNDEVAAFARSMQARGRDVSCADERYIRVGRNIRMTEFSALLGQLQLNRIDEFLFRRRQIASIYKSYLEGRSDIYLPVPEDNIQSSYWKFPVVLNRRSDRQMFIRELHALGISADASYQPPLHLQPIFRQKFNCIEGVLPITERVLDSHLCLPCHPRLSDDDAEYVATSFRDLLDKHSP